MNKLRVRYLSEDRGVTKTLLLLAINEEDHGPYKIKGFCKEQARRTNNLQTGCQD